MAQNKTTNGQSNKHDNIISVDETAVFTTPEIIDPYAGDNHHSKYWRSLQLLKPFRFPK